MRRLTVYSNGYAPYASPEPPVEAVPDILCLDRADGILYTLWSTREIMPFPTGLQSLWDLEFAHYAEGPWSAVWGHKWSCTNLAPLISCAKSGRHFTETRQGNKVD